MTAIKFLFIFIGLFLSAFFSGTETGIYRMSRFRLRLGIEQKKPFYKLLGSMAADTPNLMLSTLIGNNLANYLVTSLVTIIFVSLAGSEHAAEFYATAATAPVLFVFSELLPKSIFIYHSDFLMPRLALFMYIFDRLFTYTGIKSLLKLLSSAAAFIGGGSFYNRIAIVATRRHQISQIAAETIEEGILTPVQSRIIGRLINTPQIMVSEVCTPSAQLKLLDINSRRPDLIEVLSETGFRHFPVFEGSAENIIGYVNIYEPLNSPENFDNLRNFLHPLTTIDEKSSVSSTLDRLCTVNQRLAMVVSSGPKRRAVGLVTVKDLVEEFVGELTDI